MGDGTVLDFFFFFFFFFFFVFFLFCFFHAETQTVTPKLNEPLHLFLHSGVPVVSECHLDTPLSGTLDVLKRFCYLNVLYNYVYIFVYLCTIRGLSIGTDRAERTV